MRQPLRLVRVAASALVLTVGTACDSSDTPIADAAADTVAMDAGEDTSVDAGEDTNTDSGTGTDTGTEPGTDECERIALEFQTLGSANPDLADPEVDASCDGDTVVVNSNTIPDFPYIETSPGVPRAADVEYRFPASPSFAETTTEVPALGALGVAVNGIPIFGQAEGTGGDVLSLGSGFTECGGHNGPSGYHYHTFDVTGSDDCRFTPEQAMEGHVLFGYAFDGFPIYSGIFQFTSSYELTDESLFATDTWAAHTYVEGSGDLDECNGRTDEDGNYAYYATETFPYTVGCFRGEPMENGGGGGGPGGGGGMMP